MNHNHHSITEPMAQALQYHSYGWTPIPIRYRDKRPHFNLLKRTTGTPEWKQFQSKRPDEALIRDWFKVPAINVGLVIRDGLGVIDFDTKSAYELWGNGYGMPTVQTSRGRHVYFRNGTGMDSTQKLIHENKAVGDIKLNGYVVAPPSIHSSGRQYRWKSAEWIGGLPTIDDLPSILPGFEIRASFSVGRANGTAPPIPEPDLWNPVSIRIEEYVETTGRSHDGTFIYGLCPFHEDQSPSFWIHEEFQIWGCRTCGYHALNKDTFAALLFQQQSNINQV